MSKIYKGEYGIEIRCKTGIDLTGAQTTELHVSKPDGRTMRKTATIEAPESAGILTYTTVRGDLDVPGTYRIYSYVTFASSSFRGETAVFQVYDGDYVCL
jgi:hypothetical protein